MKERILLVGEDDLLLETRALLLAEWQTVLSNSWEATAHLAAEPFDLLILGHTVPLKLAQEIIARAEGSQNSPAVLAIRHPHEAEALSGEVQIFNLHDSPGWLRERVSRLLDSRKDAAKLPPRRTTQSRSITADGGS